MSPLADAGRALVEWYGSEARSLPWRKSSDPYSIWVSEIMLQQTTVAAVAPRYAAFLARFPDVRALAGASEDDVVAHTQGLGYYRRFRALWRAARIVVDQHGGCVPSSLAELSQLPGIGDYTAGAIASIAFGQREAAVDGNVIRVMARYLAVGGTFATARSRRELGARVVEMMPPGREGQLTQALFDLGAIVCLPKRPRCDQCPLRSSCAARERGCVDRFPEVAPRRPSVRVVVAVALIQRRRRCLVERRPDDADRMPGFWQLPEVWCREGDAAVALSRSLHDGLGVRVSVGEVVARRRHSITHHALDCRLFAVECRDAPAVGGRTRWVRDPADAAPTTTVTLKLWRALRGAAGRP